MTALMTTTSIATASLTSDLPEDLRQIVGERCLVELALQAVQVFGSDLPLWQKTTEPGLSSRMLLALLTYSYAVGIYSTEDVFKACRREWGARYLCANLWPDEHSLRRFRRSFRPLIESCLQWVYVEAGAIQSARSARWDEPTANLKQVAARKVELAIVMDLEA